MIKFIYYAKITVQVTEYVISLLVFVYVIKIGLELTVLKNIFYVLIIVLEMVCVVLIRDFVLVLRTTVTLFHEKRITNKNNDRTSIVGTMQQAFRITQRTTT